ncbi:MAG: L-carnitine dehydrogenase, partial [Acidimicrobiia bacterium]|nr:L-carnitine dehydrogenase [Acidimicrobiia bacterium]
MTGEVQMSRTIGLAGTGGIGSGWAVRVLARGYNVVA